VDCQYEAPNASLGTGTSGMIGGLPATIATSGGDLVLSVVPEPSTFALVAIAALGLLGCGWRRRRR
jgi:hypothetical protein